MHRHGFIWSFSHSRPRSVADAIAFIVLGGSLIVLFWWIVWQLARQLPWWEFSVALGAMSVVRQVLRDSARSVRRSSARTRVWVLPVRDQPASPDRGDAGTGQGLGQPGEIYRRRLER